MSSKQSPILVTGASGYLASWIVQKLLQQGYTVNATVRNLDNKEKLSHLWNMSEQHPNQLYFFEADLQKPNSFNEALKNVATVIHTASPCITKKVDSPLQQIVEPAYEGAKNLISSINKSQTVSKVVLTSSIATMHTDLKEVYQQPNRTLTNHSWNKSTIETDPYAYSKTLSEIEFTESEKKQNKWQLISLHPGAIFGPSLSKRIDTSSVEMMVQFIDGSFEKGVPNLYLGVVDVRDVADAHVTAATTDLKAQRCILVGNSYSMLDIASAIDYERHGLPNYLPQKTVAKFLLWLIAPMAGMTRKYVSRNIGFFVKFDNQDSIKKLQLTYRPLTETVNDHASQLVNDKLLDFKKSDLAATNT